ncbi:hypothetical protein ACPC54_23725 [Kitasatospora sp. NPDC094028]
MSGQHEVPLGVGQRLRGGEALRLGLSLGRTTALTGAACRQLLLGGGEFGEVFGGSVPLDDGADADTATPLDQHVCENGNPDDCYGCYEEAMKERQ